MRSKSKWSIPHFLFSTQFRKKSIRIEYPFIAGAGLIHKRLRSTFQNAQYFDILKEKSAYASADPVIFTKPNVAIKSDILGNKITIKSHMLVSDMPPNQPGKNNGIFNHESNLDVVINDKFKSIVDKDLLEKKSIIKSPIIDKMSEVTHNLDCQVEKVKKFLINHKANDINSEKEEHNIQDLLKEENVEIFKFNFKFLKNLLQDYLDWLYNLITIVNQGMSGLNNTEVFFFACAMLFVIYWTNFMKIQGLVGYIRYLYQKAQLELLSQGNSMINSKIIGKLLLEISDKEEISSNLKSKGEAILNTKPKLNNKTELKPISNSISIFSKETTPKYYPHPCWWMPNFIFKSNIYVYFAGIGVPSSVEDSNLYNSNLESQEQVASDRNELDNSENRNEDILEQSNENINAPNLESELSSPMSTRSPTPFDLDYENEILGNMEEKNLIKEFSDYIESNPKISDLNDKVQILVKNESDIDKIIETTIENVIEDDDGLDVPDNAYLRDEDEDGNINLVHGSEADADFDFFEDEDGNINLVHDSEADADADLFEDEDGNINLIKEPLPLPLPLNNPELEGNLEGDLGGDLEDENEIELDKSLNNSDSEVVEISSKKRKKKPLSGPNPKKGKGRATNIFSPEYLDSKFKAKLERRYLDKNLSLYDQLKDYYISKYEYYLSNIKNNKEKVSNEIKSRLLENLEILHKESLDNLELYKEKVNNDINFAKRFKEYPIEKIYGYTRKFQCLNWDLVTKYGYNIYIVLINDRQRVKQNLHKKSKIGKFIPYLIEYQNKINSKLINTKIDDNFNYKEFENEIFLLSKSLRFEFMPHTKLDYFLSFRKLKKVPYDVPKEYQMLEAFYREFKQYIEGVFRNFSTRSRERNLKELVQKDREEIYNNILSNRHDISKLLVGFYVDLCRKNKYYYKNDKDKIFIHPSNIKYLKEQHKKLKELIDKI